jgi:hypothetical protein
MRVTCNAVKTELPKKDAKIGLSGAGQYQDHVALSTHGIRCIFGALDFTNMP